MKIPESVHLSGMGAKPPQKGSASGSIAPVPVHADVQGASPPQGTPKKLYDGKAIQFRATDAEPPHGRSQKEQALKPVSYYTNTQPPVSIKKKVAPPVHPDVPEARPPHGEIVPTIPAAANADTSEKSPSPDVAPKKQANTRLSAYDLAAYLRERYIFKAIANQECLGVYDETKGCFLLQRAANFPQFALRAFEGTPHKSRLSRSLMKEIYTFLVFEPALQASPNDFNRNEMLINVKNGVVDLNAMRLLPHSPDCMFTSALDVNFCPTSKTPRHFLEMLYGMFGRKRADIDCCLESLAYLLSNNTSAKKMVYFLGVHDSGKSTLARLLAYIMGEGFVSALPIERFGGKFDLASLMSCRLNTNH